jgi:penicillin-binding protein 1C
LVFKIFDLLPAEAQTPKPVPPDALTVSSADALPRPMQQFATNPKLGPTSLGTRVTPPQVAYPPNGAVLSLGTSLTDRTLLLRASGGQGPLRWLVNGHLLPASAELVPTSWTAPGPGFARIVVIDAQGRSSASEIQIKLDRS